MAILLTGKAVILKIHHGRQKVVAELLPGQMLGEMSLIDGQPRFDSFVTTEPSDFAVLTTVRFQQMLDDHPSMGNKFLLMLLGLSTVRLRIATTLMLPGLLDTTSDLTVTVTPRRRSLLPQPLHPVIARSAATWQSRKS